MLDKQRLRTFVLGGIAGALAGILFAPKSGKELRGSITSRAGEARERGRETYFEAQERMQERIAEARERPPRQRESQTVADSFPKLEPYPPDPVSEPEPLIEAPTRTPPDPPPLRDVSRDVFQETPTVETPQPTSEEDPDPEEIRQKIQETRSRLRARLDAPGPEDAPGRRDG
jgi:gas vesicle protein